MILIHSKESISFLMEMEPPSTTEQERRVRIIRGRPIFYDPPKIKKAKADLTNHLITHIPDNPMEGPLTLTTIWYFPKGNSHRDGEWRTSRPDTDNLQKLLKDCMTKIGFWRDDSQVCREWIEKHWSDSPGIFIKIEKL